MRMVTGLETQSGNFKKVELLERQNRAGRASDSSLRIEFL